MAGHCHHWALPADVRFWHLILPALRLLWCNCHVAGGTDRSDLQDHLSVLGPCIVRGPRRFRIQGPGRIGHELALVPLLADREVERTGHDQDGPHRVRVPMGHDLHAWQKSDTIDVEAGLRGIAVQGDVLRRSGKSLVNDVLRKLDHARLDGLSAGWGPGRRRAEGGDK